MQGVVRSYDPISGEGVIVDAELAEFLIAEDGLEGSIFRTLRQGQRVRPCIRCNQTCTGRRGS